ncbi:MAG TPA: glycoside hydrolase family 3 N-terminal domain-containing protein, partial [Acidobacteriota bacterium]|nr:glycoside hydrolase family 3 N-terminal domain-containing protein [Acidobacteriota bacterium]
MMDQQTLAAVLGQCFWIGLNGTTINDPATLEILSVFQPGGFILFKRNVQSAAQVRKFNAELFKSTTIPPFIAVDQEGGTVERLNEIIGSIPPAMVLSANGSVKLTAQVHNVHAQILKALGFNVNFTPVLDLAVGVEGNGLGTRCFSDDPAEIEQCSRAILTAYVNENILGCGKHFPGLGDTKLDSHLELPVVTRRWLQIVKDDLQPYKKLLNELPFIMVNHALYPEMNPDLPASLAPEIIQDLLLDKWKYRGLAISDDLMMGAIANAWSLPKAAEMAISAGSHLFLICSPSGVVDAFHNLLNRALEDSGFALRIEQNYNRIVAFKRNAENLLRSQDHTKSGLHLLTKELAALTEQINSRAITWLSGKKIPANIQDFTLFVPKTKWIKKNGTSINKWLRSQGKRVTEHLYEIEMNVEDGKHLASESKTEWNIIVATGISYREGQNRLIKDLIASRKRVAIIHGSYPRDVIPDGVACAVASYWTAPVALEAATESLFNPQKARGK